MKERKGTSRLYTKYFRSWCVLEEWLLEAPECTRNCINIWFREWGEIQGICDGKQMLWSIFKVKWVERQISVTALLTETKQRCCWSDSLEESSNKTRDLTSPILSPSLLCVSTHCSQKIGPSSLCHALNHAGVRLQLHNSLFHVLSHWAPHEMILSKENISLWLPVECNRNAWLGY